MGTTSSRGWTLEVTALQETLRCSELKECFEQDTVGVPAPEPLPHDDKDMPFFIVADDAFRARRIVENAFGILAHRYQCLLRTMRQKPSTVVLIVTACVCLHNLMRLRYPAQQNADIDQEDQNHNVVPSQQPAVASQQPAGRCLRRTW